MHSLKEYRHECGCVLCGAVRGRAKRLGVTIEEAIATAPAKPQFLLAAEEEAARTGKTADEVLRADMDRMMNPEYPGLLCMNTEEAARIVKEGRVAQGRDSVLEVLETAVRLAHVEDCPFCNGLVELISKVSQPREVKSCPKVARGFRRRCVAFLWQKKE